MRHLFFLTKVVLLMLVTSCSEDLYEEHTEINKVKTVNLQDLPFLEQNINQRRASFKSTSESAIDYFSLIETQDILLVEQVDGTKDYTFALKLPYQDTLTNLIAQEKNNTITYSLIKYTAQNQEAWLQGLESNNPFAIPVTVTQFGIDSKSNPLCIKLKGTCPSGLHDLSTIAGCDFKDLGSWTFNITYYVCDNGGGSTGSSSAGDSGGSTGSSSAGDSGGTGGSSPSDPNANNTSGGSSGTGTGPSTFPKPCKTCDFSGTGNTPCENLKKVSNNPYIKAGMIELKPKYTENVEHGYSIKTDGNGGYLPLIPASLTNNGTAVLMLTGTSCVGGLHCHFQDNDPEKINHDEMFSDHDINTLFKFSINHNTNGQPKNYNDYFLHMNNKDATYMIKIKDVAKFYAFRDSDEWNNKNNTLEKLTYKYNKLSNGTSTQYINEFLTYLEEVDAGIGLYVADDNFNWSELNLVPGAKNNNTITPKKTPCP